MGLVVEKHYYHYGLFCSTHKIGHKNIPTRRNVQPTMAAMIHVPRSRVRSRDFWVDVTIFISGLRVLNKDREIQIKCLI